MEGFSHSRYADEGSKMKELFAQDAGRFQKFSHRFEDILIDFFKNILTEETLKLLTDLANECKLKEAVSAMFEGELINETEGRAVLHTACATASTSSVYRPGQERDA